MINIFCKRLFNLNHVTFILIIFFIGKIDLFSKNLIFSNSSSSTQTINLENWTIDEKKY